MVDTWATVGSCAQIGKSVHLSGGVGIGGVLEPPQAAPVVIEDDVFVGSRSHHRRGRPGRQGRQARRRRDPHLLHAGHRRRHRRGAGPGRHPGAGGGCAGHPARDRSPAASSACLRAGAAHPRRGRGATTSSPSTRSCASTAGDVTATVDVDLVEAIAAPPTPPRPHRRAGRRPFGQPRRGGAGRRRGGPAAPRPHSTSSGSASTSWPAPTPAGTGGSCWPGTSTPCPPTATRSPVEGDVLHGLGAADMKGGLAVLLRLAEEVGRRQPASTSPSSSTRARRSPTSTTASATSSPSRPDLVAGDFAVLLEPTDGWLEAGCQGIHPPGGDLPRARGRTPPGPGRGRTPCTGPPPSSPGWPATSPRTVEVDGLASARRSRWCGCDGGVAGNVVPDRCTVVVNRRYAPASRRPRPRPRCGPCSTGRRGRR